MDDWPKWDTELVDGHYNVASVAHKFNDLDRYTRGLKKSDATIFDLDLTNYAESLAMFSAITFTIGLSLMVILLLITCMKCCCSSKRKRSRDDREQKKSFIKIVLGIFLMIFIVVGLVGHVIGYLGEKKVSGVIDNTCKTFDFAQTKLETIFDTTGKIQLEVRTLSTVSMNNIQVNIQQAKEHVAEIPNSDDLKQKIDSFDETFAAIKTQVQNTADNVNSEINPDDFKTIMDPLKEGVKICNDVKDNANSGMLIFTGVFALLIVLFLAALMNNCSRYICAFLGFFQLALMLIFLSALIPLLVGGSDACFNARPLINRHVPDSPIIKYYLDCPNENVLVAFRASMNAKNSSHKRDFIDDLIENLDKYFDAAEKQLQEFDTKITEINTELKCDQPAADTPAQVTKLCNDIKNLRDGLMKDSNDKTSVGNMIEFIKTDVKRVADQLDCNELTPKLYSSMTDVCTNIYLSVLHYSINFAVAFVALWMLVFISSMLT